MQVLASIFVSLSIAAAKPFLSRTSTIQNGITSDAPFSVPQEQLDALPLICPNGIQADSQNNILFLHGTGGNGNESWAGLMLPALYTQGSVLCCLPSEKKLIMSFRYNGCYANLPNRTLSDAQVTSEYVVSLVDRLYSAAGNNPINVIGHSQGNLNIQWVLNFWPSRRTKVATFISLAGDFQGTSEGPIIDALQQIAVQGANPSFLQQSVILGLQSAYLLALNKHGNMALVPTTSIYTLTDDITQVEPNSSTLGAGPSFVMLAVQEACPLQVPDHFGLLASVPAFYLILNALSNGGLANLSQTLAAHPTMCLQVGLPGTTAPEQYLATARELFQESLSVLSEGVGTPGGLLSQRTQLEPPLKPYAASQP
jgi:pimeloyl-ACP methyl ester carboxylesterase